MSKATKRKHVTKEVLTEFALPEGNREVVKILSGRGNNLHEAQTGNGDVFLISMPTKFRKNVWIKRGDFVMVEPIEEGDKVKAEITHILYKEQIKYIKEENLWPEAFEVQDKEVSGQGSLIPDDMLPPSSDEDYDSCDDEDDDEEEDKDGDNDEQYTSHVSNPNRRVQICTEREECGDENVDH